MRHLLPPQPASCRNFRPARRLPLVVAMLLLAGPPAARDAAAQAVVGEPTDLSFTVRDATTGQPGNPERLTLDYVAGRMNNILDTQPAAAAFTVQAVPVKDNGQYIVTLWYQGVPYWWQKRGSDLLAGPVTLDVFAVTDDLQAVKITGLNLVVQHRETIAELEYMVELDNRTSPQATVFRTGGTFALDMPAGVTDVAATYLRGPEPTPVAAAASGARMSFAMPLTPGTNRLRVTARVPWEQVLDLMVGSDLPIGAWSLLTNPPTVTVEAAGLERADEQSVPGFVRRAGPALPAGESMALRLSDGAAAGTPGKIFTTSEQNADTAGAANAGKQGPDKRGFPLPLAALLILVIIGALAVARRGRS